MTSWVEWPNGVIRLGVVLLAAVSAAAALVSYPSALLDLGREAGNNSRLSYSDREIAGGNSVLGDQVVAYAARALIPPNETYHVAVAPDFPGGTELTVPYVESYLRSFLLPRRPAEDGRWVICYGCDLSQYGGEANVRWRNDAGVSILTRPDGEDT